LSDYGLAGTILESKMSIMLSLPDGAALAGAHPVGRRRGRWTAPVLAALMLASAGCAPYVWHRPGTSASVMAQDELECDEFAHRLSLHLDVVADADRDWPGGWRRPPYGGFSHPGGSLAFKVRTAQRCMEAKGYRLVKQPARMSPP
jgi:hypothetical protein